MPITAQLDTGLPGQAAPLEGADESKAAGYVASAGVGFISSLGITGIQKAQAALAGGPMVSQQDAQAKMKAQGYDSTGIPEAGVTQGALDVMMNRQSDLRVNANIAQRANLGGVSRFVTSIVGGAGDPTNLVFGAAGEVVAPLMKGGVALRAATGAAVGGGFTAAQTYGTQALGHGLGDEDQSSMANLRSILFGSVVGGGLHVGFGGKAPILNTPGAADLRDGIIGKIIKTEGGTTVDTGGLTRFGISEKAHPDVDIANLTPTDAAKIIKTDYWDKIDGEKLPAELQHTALDAAVNQGVDKANQWIKESGGDPEKFNQLREEHYRSLAAQNPAKYGKFLDGWLNRLKNVAQEPLLAPEQAPRIKSVDQMGANVDELPADTRMAAGQTAVAQFLADDNVNVEPVINKSLEEIWGVKPDTAEDPTGMNVRGINEGDKDVLPLSMEDVRRLQGDDTDLSKSIPQPGRALVSSNDNDRIALVREANAAKVEEVPKSEATGPLTSEAKAAVGEAVKEAEAFKGHTQAPFEPDPEATPAQNAAAKLEYDAEATDFDKEMAAHDETIKAHEEFAKSVEAAVRCGTELGVE